MAVRAAPRTGGLAVRPQSIATLKTITLRLSSTSSTQLAQLAAAISASIWSCRDLLSAHQDALKANSGVSTLVHRYKTHLSTLLQARAVEARWAAVVLVKATVEAGGLETLSKANAWVRNLLAILKKHDPPTTRTLAVLTLTRIFMLTWEHSNLVREITTPALSSFIPACLNNAASNRCSARELHAILESFSALLPRHPTIFRSNETQTRALLGKIISSKSSISDATRHFTIDHQKIASELWVQLHRCAPKQTSTEVWEATFSTTIRATHATCDRVFRCVVERWETVAGVQPSAPSRRLSSDECAVDTDDILGLDGWQGVDQGMQRLISLIDLLSVSLKAPTPAQVSVKVGQLFDLLSRLLAIRPDATNFNPQIPKDERDAMMSQLPAMHESTLSLAGSFLSRYTSSVSSVVQPLLAEIVTLAQVQAVDTRVRRAIFKVVQHIIRIIGPSMTKEDVSDLEGIIRACCESVLPAEQTKTEPVDVAIPATESTSRTFAETTEARQAARNLLPVLIARLKPSCLSPRTRTRMERTAILAQHKHAMIACVLNPATGGPRTQASLLPMLARQYPSCHEVEAIIRPRMPVILSEIKRSEEEQDHKDEEEVVENELETANDLVNDAEASDEPVTIMDHIGKKHIASAAEGNVIFDKRNIALDGQVDRPAKRLRASPEAESLLLGATVALAEDLAAFEPTPQIAAVSAPPSRTVRPSTQPATLPTHGAPVHPTTRDEDDDSDFEMPPLTMDPDTDPEDE